MPRSDHIRIEMLAIPTSDGETMWSWECSCGDGSDLVDCIEVAGQEADEHVCTGRTFR